MKWGDVFLRKEIIKPEDCISHPERLCRVTTSGNVIEVLEMSTVNLQQTIERIDNDHVVVLSTGEVKAVEHGSKRIDSVKSLRLSMKKLLDLINANVTDPARCRWVTLTYAENMTDSERLRVDVKNYHKRWKRWHDSHGYSVPEYILAVEPQLRGAWHCHVIYIYPSTAPYVPNGELARLWGQGFVQVKALDGSIDNLGAYLTAYLCDVSIDELPYDGFDKLFPPKYCTVIGDDGVMHSKKVLKGARLGAYPAGMNFFRTSRGVKRPTVEWLSVSEVEKKKKVSSDQLTFEKTVRLVDDEQDFSCDLHYWYYNLARNNSQE